MLLGGCTSSTPSPSESLDTTQAPEEMPEIPLLPSRETDISPAESETPLNPVSLPSLMEETFTGNMLTLEQILAQNEDYTRYRISYQANGLTLSGIMNIPTGEGPFPLLILNHGYIDPAVYTNGRGLKREQDYFAKAGFAVVHPDYRNHALSDRDENTTRNFRLGYTADVIGAILAVQNSVLPELQNIDAKRVGMLGHSMGGGITQNVLVVRPELVQAAVLYAPVSGNAVDNLEEYFLQRPQRNTAVEEIFAAHGSPQEAPEFWKNISPETFVERVLAPVQIHIGTNDESTPPQWSDAIAENLRNSEKEVELLVYENEKHEFISQWSLFMERSTDFFNTHLRESSF